MTTWTAHHPCPEPECEDGEVTAEYEVGQGREGFILTTDTLTCTQGHLVPQTILDRWWDQDCQTYQEIQWDRQDAALEAREDARLERFMRKEGS